ncbi:MAG: methyltransferase domain-containing protein [Dehalococcoidia bacterium]|nr:methyltransferase domain-containing protein [Dehalococcoidia bacterium]
MTQEQRSPSPDATARWDPHQYFRFSDHRLRPALELIDRINHPSPSLICDLGCGTGQVTLLLGQRWPAARVIGVDNSPEMLTQARRNPGAAAWVEVDIERWVPSEAPDIIYSNATLHWLDGHQTLFPRLVSFLKPGGVLAVQMPLSWPMPSHRLMRETLADGGANGGPLGSEGLRREAARDWVAPAAAYYDLLTAGASTVDIWETQYLQVLEGPDPVLEWVKGTGLRPVLLGLEPMERDVFLAAYKLRLRSAYPARPNGETIYPFRRLFIVATV